MGAGDFPAGEGPSGHTPQFGAPADNSTKRAAYFDMFLRSYPVDGSGELKAIHPVDQAVALALGIRLGGIASAAQTGLDVERLRRASRATLAITVRYVVAEALATLIGEGDIQFLGAPLTPDANGRPFFFVDYRNLRLPSRAVGPTRIPVRL